MCSSSDCIRILNEHMPQIQKDFEVTGLCVFGSVARGDNRPDSDVDILVDMPPKLLLMSELKLFLEEILHSSVDLVRRHAHLSQRFLNQIQSHAIVLL